MASVSIKNVQKSYGAAKVIHGVDVSINDGEFVVLVGPSGCGKSTLLRMIAGLETISGGDIAIGSNVVNDMPPKQRDIAMVFQSYALYPHMTVAENMAFSLRLKGASPEEKTEKVGRAAAILGLEPLLGRYPKELSGGQRQRVAMGRAIVRNPQVFLFDEPLSNLDAKLRAQMRAEIKQLHQRLRTTTIYVTHDQIEAMTMADKIVVMRDGKVEQIGTPMELYEKPANLFVASFIGSPGMNFLSGSVKADAPTKFETDSGSKIELGRAFGDSLVGKPLILGIRPQRLTVGGKDADGLPAKISVVEPTGAETILLVNHGAETLTVSTTAQSKYDAGDLVKLAVDPGSPHLFDKTTGKRMVGLDVHGQIFQQRH
ncbi:ABC transporter ATP-binding protein [Rhizobium mayense]|uniref:Sn-glycerol-3-phosphate ABC transporter ATP-binding protein UgpC n=1 Tax=Rhizobium mayense TaxID=1312184 RepID=A0ABT7K4H5_9HYPH|nr:sn-glycerol-3-phosphate ABC transporter ATP-binding protein UgpC [Rhizobium mayense]MDL2403524.1 sn-glycerol-3-phosphate ABC transporter ATP-binding protein UgpC [Rhizobium mayense]